MANIQKKIERAEEEIKRLREKQSEQFRREYMKVVEAVGKVCLDKNQDWFRGEWERLRQQNCPKKYRTIIDSYFNITSQVEV